MPQTKIKCFPKFLKEDFLEILDRTFPTSGENFVKASGGILWVKLFQAFEGSFKTIWM